MTHLIQWSQSNLTNPSQNAAKRVDKMSFHVVNSLKLPESFSLAKRQQVSHQKSFAIRISTGASSSSCTSSLVRSRTSWFLVRKALQSGVQGFMRWWTDGTDGTCPLIACAPDGVGPWQIRKIRISTQVLSVCWVSHITTCGSWPILDVACRADCPSNNKTSTRRLTRSVVTACVENQSTHQHVNGFPGSPSQALPKVQASSPWHWGPVSCSARKTTKSKK